MELDLNQIITLFIVFVSILFVSYLVSSNSRGKLNNILIVIFLIINAIDSSSRFIGLFIFPDFPRLGMMISLSIFLQIPALYLYILSTIYSDFKLKKNDLLHLLPYLLIIILYIPIYFSLESDAKLQFLVEAMTKGRIEITLTYIFIYTQILFYLIFSFVAVNKYKHLLLENYSDANMFNYRWMFQLLCFYSIVVVLGGISYFFSVMHIDFLVDYARLLDNLFILGLISWMVLKTLHHPELFRNINSDMQLVKNLNESMNSVHNNVEVVKENSINIQKLEKLDRFMNEKKPFLDPTLTLIDLANQLDIKKQELSLLINNNLNQHFFDFINGYRIRLAMDILKDPSKKEFTVLEILYEVGFNSKSSFNAAFKKLTNFTPTQYRRKYIVA